MIGSATITREYPQTNAADGVLSLRTFFSALISLASIFYVYTWPISRDFGAPALAVVVVPAIVYCLVFRRIQIGATYLALLLIVGVYIALSLLDVFSLSWTSGRYNRYIPQQSLVYFMLPFMVTVYYDFIIYLYNARRLRILLFFILIISLTVGALFKQDFQFFAAVKDAAQIGDFANQNFMKLLALLVLFRKEINQSRYAWLVVPILLFIVAGDFQTRLASALLAPILIGNRPQLKALIIFLLVTIAVIVAPFFLHAIMKLDTNAAVRAVYWRHALDAMLDNNFMGIGFGTQSVSTYFREFGDWRLTTNQDQLYLTGLHNSFYQFAFRCGVAGLSLVIIWVLSVLKGLERGYNLKLRVFVWLLLIISMMVNPSLESVNFLFGNAFALAMIFALGQMGPEISQRAKTSGQSTRRAGLPTATAPGGTL